MLLAQKRRLLLSMKWATGTNYNVTELHKYNMLMFTEGLCHSLRYRPNEAILLPRL
jgi:hypothetical protein